MELMLGDNQACSLRRCSQPPERVTCSLRSCLSGMRVATEEGRLQRGLLPEKLTCSCTRPLDGWLAGECLP